MDGWRKSGGGRRRGFLFLGGESLRSFVRAELALIFASISASPPLRLIPHLPFGLHRRYTKRGDGFDTFLLQYSPHLC